MKHDPVGRLTSSQATQLSEEELRSLQQGTRGRCKDCIAPGAVEDGQKGGSSLRNMFLRVFGRCSS